MAASPIYQVEDAEVLTVGLVPQGANQEEFFLIKSADGGGEMTDEPRPINSEIPQGEALLQAILATIQKAEATPQEIATKMLEAVKGMTIPADLKWVMRVLESLAAGKKPEYGYPYPHSTPMKKEAAVEETPTMPEPTPVSPELLAKIEMLEKARDQLQARLEKAEQEAAIERAERRLVELVKQAETWKALPLQPRRVAELLAWIEKQDDGAPRAAELTDLLGTVDRTLATSQIFKEFGSSALPKERSLLEEAEKLAKAEGIPIDEAILRVPAQLQEGYLSQEV